MYGNVQIVSITAHASYWRISNAKINAYVAETYRRSYKNGDTITRVCLTAYQTRILRQTRLVTYDFSQVSSTVLSRKILQKQSEINFQPR